MTTNPISKYADVIDSRDVIERIEELQNRRDSGLSTAESAELDALIALQKECSGFSNWYDGITLIHDVHFEEYATDFADEIMDVPVTDLHWPYSCIDWKQAAKELQMDYIAVEYMGQTFWTYG